VEKEAHAQGKAQEKAETPKIQVVLANKIGLHRNYALNSCSEFAF
jgi:hypothetical protein